MATELSPAGDVARDAAEATAAHILAAESILVEALTEAPVEPVAWAQYIGRALKALRQAREQNETTKGIIYEARRRR